MDDAELMAHVNVLAERDAEKIAWVEAQPVGAKARNTGMIVTVLAIVALATGITTLVEGAAQGVSPVAATASVIFGAIGALVGGAVWQAGAGAIREEFSRRMPDAVARLRREYAATYHVRQQASPSAGQPQARTPPAATF